MKGDYYRYIAEYASGDQKNVAAMQADSSYKEAHELAVVKDDSGNDVLSSTNPLRLGLALNYSVFYYEIKQDANKACKMARDAFDEAIADLDDIDDDFYKDATLIMQLLRDNLTLWTEEVEADMGGNGDN
jgi:14-3-3 protein epsilon